MSVILSSRRKFIIDKTLINDKELICKNRNQIDCFLTLLNKIGADLIEIDRNVVEKINIEGNITNFAYLVKDEQDMPVINDYDFKYLILDIKIAKNFDNSSINSMNRSKIILEVDVKDLNAIFSDINYEIFNNFNVFSIRVKNVKKCNINGWCNIIREIKNELGVLVDFCADDDYYMATAIVVEACNDGADFVTTAFNGEEYNLASLEEFILACKIINNAEVTGNLKMLKVISEVYEKLSNRKVSGMKPVIGQDIFKCESGIHVDGIEKKSITYEPYGPNEVGMERELIIGKHSGSKAVEVKLKQLNIKSDNLDIDKFLLKIREKSIELHRNIFDDELKDMYESFK
ncbi:MULTISPECIES: homocitrate synthase/isopropylmalate synthase family protein [Clostridium]|uniref:homocitrate synthase/isopropylmalate synthase family protein n=1 Tax=Clostridium TaxID=1485 RepID=UPI000824DFC1|nr:MULTISPECIES: homocitrate synthase [Clostridium]PJI08100.1 homocitrate synthase [Clostridium sp. CT7]